MCWEEARTLGNRHGPEVSKLQKDRATLSTVKEREKTSSQDGYILAKREWLRPKSATDIMGVDRSNVIGQLPAEYGN